MPTTMEIGQRLVELCRQKKNLEAVDTLYAPDIVSVEVHGTPEMSARMEGIKAIRGKNEWWLGQHDIHSIEVNGPWPHGDRFIVTMKMDVTAKEGPFKGKRMQFEEAGLYTVRDGKIAKEEFFFHMG
jgi:ketosteroid isomerase-like protein